MPNDPNDLLQARPIRQPITLADRGAATATAVGNGSMPSDSSHDPDDLFHSMGVKPPGQYPAVTRAILKGGAPARFGLGAAQETSDMLSRAIEAGALTAGEGAHLLSKVPGVGLVGKLQSPLQRFGKFMQKRREAETPIPGKAATAGRIGGAIAPFLTGAGEAMEAPTMLGRAAKWAGFGASQDPEHMVRGAATGAITSPAAEIVGAGIGKAAKIPFAKKAFLENELIKKPQELASQPGSSIRQPAQLKAILQTLPKELQDNLSLGDLINHEPLKQLYHNTLGSLPFSDVSEKNTRLRASIVNEGRKSYDFFRGKSRMGTINDDLRNNISKDYNKALDKNSQNYEDLDKLIEKDDFFIEPHRMKKIRNYIDNMYKAAKSDIAEGYSPEIPRDILNDKTLEGMKKFGSDGAFFSKLVSQMKIMNKRSFKQTPLTDPWAEEKGKIYAELQSKMHDVASKSAADALRKGLAKENLYKATREAAAFHQNVIVPMRKAGVKKLISTGKGVDTLSNSWLRSENNHLRSIFSPDVTKKLIFQHLSKGKGMLEDHEGNILPEAFAQFARNYRRLPTHILDEIPPGAKKQLKTVEKLAPIASEVSKQLVPPQTGMKLWRSGVKFGPPVVGATIGAPFGLGGAAAGALAADAIPTIAGKKIAKFLRSPELKKAYINGKFPVGEKMARYKKATDHLSTLLSRLGGPMRRSALSLASTPTENTK
jgi:hypothetical protein